jgi:hypothetical protein
MKQAGKSEDRKQFRERVREKFQRKRDKE